MTLTKYKKMILIFYIVKNGPNVVLYQRKELLFMFLFYLKNSEIFRLKNL
jgi:hypothetical protein